MKKAIITAKISPAVASMLGVDTSERMECTYSKGTITGTLENIEALKDEAAERADVGSGWDASAYYTAAQRRALRKFATA